VCFYVQSVGLGKGTARPPKEECAWVPVAACLKGKQEAKGGRREQGEKRRNGQEKQNGCSKEA